VRGACTWLVLAIAAIGFAASARAADPLAIVPVDGEPFAAALAALDDDGTLLLATADGERSLPLNDLVSIGAPAPWGHGTWVLLADGGLLAADVLGLANEALQIDSSALGPRSLPLERVAGVLLRPPSDPRERDPLIDRLLAAEGATDRLLLENGDELAGTLAGLSDYELEVSVGGETQRVPLERTVAVVLNPQLQARRRADRWGTLVGLSDGSLLRAESLSINDAGANLTLAGVEAWTLPAERIALVQPLAGRAVYLSDLPVSGYKHVPFLTLEWPYTLDRAVTGTRLAAGGRMYSKGVGMHSAARLTFKLDRPYRRLDALAAIDDAAGPGGSVTFRVFVGREERFASAPVRGGQPPVPVSVDLSGAETVSLVVDFGERGDERDYADWLEARLVE
jgi:hypothetical protein